MVKQAILEEVERVTREGMFAPTWDSLGQFEAPKWYQNAKLGIFIHWGVYAVPAFVNEWYPRHMYIQGTAEYQHHIETYGPHKTFGYKDFIPMFRAQRFAPTEWAKIFKAAGAQYVIPVAEHHDGFMMYASELSPWNAVQMGPKRDVIGELEQAVRGEGLHFGVSSHRAEHYFFMGEGMHFDSDLPDAMDFYGPAKTRTSYDDYKDCPPDEAFLEDWLARTCELIDRYRPEVIYFDTWIMNLCFKPYLKKLAAYYYNRGREWQMEVAINYKNDAMPPECGVLDVECGHINDVSGLMWQKDMTLTTQSWGYIQGQTCKPLREIVSELIDVVSKNGTLLLNVAPRADGTIPEDQQQTLYDLGKWLETYGEAIYDTTPFLICGEGPSIVPGLNRVDYTPIDYTAGEIRVTQKGDRLYVFAMNLPESKKIVVRTLSKGMIEAMVGTLEAEGIVGSPRGATCAVTDEGLVLEAPEAQVGEIVIFRVKMTLK